MPSWIRRIISRAKNFDLLGSVWISNLDNLVGNIQYLQNDGNKCKQSDITNQSDKSNESNQCVESTDRTSNICGNCNGTRPNCYCTYNIKRRTRYYDDIGYRGGINQLDNDLISLQLSGEERLIKGNITS